MITLPPTFREELRSEMSAHFQGFRLYTSPLLTIVPSVSPSTVMTVMSNTTDTTTRDSSGIEHRSRLLVQVDHYSNAMPTPVIDAFIQVENMVVICDEVFMRNGFMRKACTLMPSGVMEWARYMSQYTIILDRQGISYRI